MKTILKAYSILFLIGSLAISTTAIAGDEPKIDKKKTYSKSYDVNANDKISFTNQFGELKLNTWNKNEVKVDITITAKANTDERAQQILDGISIEDGKSSSGVYFKTKMNNKSNTHNKNDKEKYRNEGFSINYIVYLPAGNPLYANNSFGETTIPDYRGEAEIISKFGGLEVGNLANAKAVTIEFGKANIESMNGGKLTVKFSKAIVNKLTGDINANFEHSGGIKLGIDNNIKGLTVSNNFSTLYLDVNKNLSADFDIRTHFGDVSNKTEFPIKKEEEDENRRGPQFDHRYTGKSGGGNVTMKIRSEFGKIIVGHNLTMSLADEKKEKKPVRSI